MVAHADHPAIAVGERPDCPRRLGCRTVYLFSFLEELRTSALARTVLNLTLRLAAGPPAKPDVDDEVERQAKTRPKMYRGCDRAQGFAAGVVEQPAGRDKKAAERQHAGAGEAVFPRAPGAAHVQGHEDSEDNERQHRCGAVETE